MAALNEKAIPTICAFCHAHCGLIAYVSNGILRRTRPDPNHPASRGYICQKGAAARQVVYSPHRLKYPLRRTKKGFQHISWEEALDIIATRLLEIRAKHGAGALVRCNGAPVTRATFDGFVQLMNAYGSPNYVGAGHLCHLPRETGFSSVYGGMAQADYEKTRCIVLWGTNLPDSRNPGEVAYGRFSRLIPEAKRRGARLMVIDPRRTEMADMADKWLAIAPGRDDALALATLNVVINEDLYDKEFVARWTVGFEQLREHVKRFTPEWAQAITGLPASDIRDFARMYATTRPALIRVGNGIDPYPNSVQTARAIGILIAITGNLDIEGGNVFFHHPVLSHLIRERLKVESLGARKYPLFPEIPFPYFVDLVLAGGPAAPRAMIVYHANPGLIDADSTRTRKALEKLELLVVCDIFKSATAELADIILPETSEFERYDFEIYDSARGGFIALRQKVIEPVGESRSAFEIEYELAKRMGLEAAYPWTNTEEWIDHRLKASGITLNDLKKQQIIYTTPSMEYRKYLKSGFKTPSGKVEIYSQQLQDHGYPPLPEYRELDESLAGQPGLVKRYPLIGTTRRPGVYVHTRFRNIPALRKLEPEALMRISPGDASSKGIEDGDLTVVTSPTGSIEVRAKVTDEVSPGVVIIDFGWGNPGDPGPNVNILTSDEDRDPISGSTANRRFRCRVSKAKPR
jgi:anaerobic selenocysteine-containing dehydrogenase